MTTNSEPEVPAYMRSLPELPRIPLDPPAVIPSLMECGCRDWAREAGDLVNDHHKNCEYRSFVAYYMKRDGVGWMYLGSNPAFIAEAACEELKSSFETNDHESIELVPCLCSEHEEGLMPEFEGF